MTAEKFVGSGEPFHSKEMTPEQKIHEQREYDHHLEMFQSKYPFLRYEMCDALARYVSCGYPVGGFLRLVLTNAPYKTVLAKADSRNQARIMDYAMLTSNEMPSVAQGDEYNFQRWQWLGGLVGQGVYVAPVDLPQTVSEGAYGAPPVAAGG